MSTKTFLLLFASLIGVALVSTFTLFPTPDNITAQGVTVDSNYNRQHCSGSHCTFIATWAVDDQNNSFEFLDGIITTDTLALGFGIKNQAGQTTTSFQPGDSFTVPIDASGEIVGHAGRFYDSPPVYFETNGRLRAVTQGLDTCGFTNVTLDNRKCEGISSNGGDVIGKWQDSWQATAGSGGSVSTVSCTSNAAGTLAQCTSTSAASGQIKLELTRTVDDLKWQGADVLTDNNAAQAAGKLFTSGLKDPFPGSMKSTVTVTFATPTSTPTTSPSTTPSTSPTTSPSSTPTPVPECSDGVDNDDDDLVDCADFGCWTDPQDSTTCIPEDDNENHLPGFTPGPFQEQD